MFWATGFEAKKTAMPMLAFLLPLLDPCICS